MKKYLALVLAVLMVLSLGLVGCGKKEEGPSDTGEELATQEPTPTPVIYDTTVNFSALLLDANGSPISGGQLAVTVGADVFSANSDAEGKLTINGLPAGNRMNAKISDASGAEKASFSISIWSGYPLSWYTNQDLVSIDIQKGTPAIFTTLQLSADGFVACKSASETGFAEPQPSPTSTGSENTGENGGDDPAVTPGQALGTKYVNSDGVNVRSTASTSGDKVASLEIGTEVSVTDEGTADGSYKWYQISFTSGGEQKTGYIRNDFISDTKKVTKDGVNMRAGASTSSSKVTTLSINTTVYLLDDGTKDGDYTWYKVSCKSSGKIYKGYIRNDMLG